jgi:cystathionine beta-lyase
VLKPVPEKAVLAFLDALSLFGLGVSWGGFESLVIPVDVKDCRSATKFEPGGPALRFHIGLEDVGDLIADLERGFAALAATRLSPT